MFQDLQKRYQEFLAERLNIVNDGEMTSKDYWSALKSSILSTAEEVVGYDGRTQPTQPTFLLKSLCDCHAVRVARLMSS